jgi:tRNA nucleotidyltransferase (CCA-adding enzyme)
MAVDKLLSGVLAEITPTTEERTQENKALEEILLLLKQIIRKINGHIDPVMVGSIAKGTDLRGDKDFDIFIRFPEKTLREKLEADGLKIGKTFFEHVKSRPVLSYAEHPYVKGQYKGYDVEVVPCYRLKDHAKASIISSVDRTPLHTEFVLSELSKKPRMRDQIRLLKKFMKAGGLYGAHAAVEGFSGYLCELLVIKYGSFTEVLHAGSKWKKHERLFIGKEGGKHEFPDAPLTFIDPVDEGRNVAAAVSVEKLARFIYAAEAFLQAPSAEFFRAKEAKAMPQREFRGKVGSRGTELIAIRFRVPPLVEDTLIPQLAKSLKHLSTEAERAGFRILKKAHWTDGLEAVLLIEFEVWELPRVMKKSGPFFDSKVADMRGFVEANKPIAMSGLYLEGDQWAIDVRREHTRAVDFVKAALKDPKGFGKDLRKARKFDILVNEKIGKIKKKDFWEFMGGFW